VNTYLFSAGCLAFLVGIVHSVLGEILIFRHMRMGTLVPTYGGEILKERRVRILWASWHLVTVFGAGLGVSLIGLSFTSSRFASLDFIELVILFSMLVSSLIVLAATKGKHPGWVGLLGVAVLIWLGR